MNIFDVLYVGKTGKIKPDASLMDNLFGKKFYDAHSAEEKTIDFTPVISVSDAKAGNALDYQFKITAKQEGTNPSPDNICPIDGWTGANITRTGKNLFLTTASSKEENGIIYTVNADGTISVSGTASGFSSINCGDADISGIHGKVTVSGIATATNMVWSGIRLYDSDNVQLYDTGASSAPSITIDLANYPTAVKLTIIIKRQNNVVTSGVIMPQVEVGQTATAYAPYETPTVYPVSWLSEAGTVYGGILDVTTGTLTVTHTISIIDENIDGGIASVGGLWFADGVNTSDILTGYCGLSACNAYKLHTGNSSTSSAKDNMTLYEFCGCTQSNRKTRVFFRDERFATTEELKEWLEDNPITIVQMLAEPITYTLTPTEITLAEGANTIWSDTGDSKLTYLAKKS